MIELEGEDGARVIVAPELQGRVLTSRVGPIESAAYVSEAEIAQGETDRPFNNFGGQDRLWLGPEAGVYGLFFPPGAPFERERWRVPRDLNRGAFRVLSRERGGIVLEREVTVVNDRATTIRARIVRDVSVLSRAAIEAELGARAPREVAVAGSASVNVLANAGDERWTKEAGLPHLWIVGQHVAGPRALVVAPFRPGSQAERGRVADDSYFGPPPGDRLRIFDDVVAMRADGRGETKLGMSPRRTRGRAGAYDPDRSLLAVVRFDVAWEGALYGSSLWRRDLADPYAGDALQAYNSDGGGFFEIESASRSEELAPGEQLDHRHATFYFHGPAPALADIARDALGADLDALVRAFEPGR